MPKQDIVVIGASAGGVEALQKLIPQLPQNLPAAIFVVMHLPNHTRSWLPEILNRVSTLNVRHAEDGEPIEHGRIYIARSDYHLLLERDHIHLGRGPKEQHQRPCINVTLRSAALTYGERVVGVVLTGELDDGTAGLWDVKRRGGVAIVQNPEEAAFPSMPLNALREIEADYTLRLDEIAPVLVHLTSSTGDHQRTKIESKDMKPQLTDLTCPDCRGTIWEVARANGKEYRCRVGHTYSAKSMLVHHFAVQERSLYSAIVALEEGASLAYRLAGEFGDDVRDRLSAEAHELQVEAQRLRNVVEQHRPFELD